MMLSQLALWLNRLFPTTTTSASIPLYNNLAACLVMVVYFKLCLETIYWLRSKRFLILHYSRDIVQMLLSSCVLFWNWFDTSDRSWRLVALIPAVMLARFIYKGAMLKDPEDIEVQTLSRSSAPSELLYGPSHSAIILIWMSCIMFQQPESAVIAASLAVTDGFAPLIGKLYGRHVYHYATTKRKEGTIVGMFLGTILYCYLYQWWMGFTPSPLRVVLAYGGIAAVIGTVFRGMDNLAVPIALHLLIPRIHVWMLATE